MFFVSSFSFFLLSLFRNCKQTDQKKTNAQEKESDDI